MIVGSSESRYGRPDPGAEGHLPLVGRREEMHVIDGRLTTAATGSFCAIFVHGEAGIGKSRIVQEALRHASQMGFATLSGCADESSQRIPYQVLMEALAPAFRTDDDPRQARLIEDVRRALTPISNVNMPPEVDSGGESIRLAYTSTERLVRAWSHCRPLLIALEDLHWADQDTMTAIALLVRHLSGTRCLLLGTYRSQAPELTPGFQLLIDRLLSGETVSLLSVSPLDQIEVRDLASLILGGKPDIRLANVLFEVSSGNPFMVTEAAQSLVSVGAIEIHNGEARVVPDYPMPTLGRPSALLHRILRLGSDAFAIARTLSAFQRVSPRRLDLLAKLTRLPPERVDRAFDALVGANIVRRSADGRFEFCHPIIRHTLHNDLGPAARRRLHGRIVEWLKVERRQGVDVDVVELATHVVEVADVGDRQAAEVLRDAGDASMMVAPSSAASWYGRALALLGDNAQEKFALTIRQVRALYLAGRLDEAVVLGRVALDFERPAAEQSELATVVVRALIYLGRLDDALTIVDAALNGGHEETSRLLALRALVLTYLDRFNDAQKAASRSLRAARADVTAQARAIGQHAAIAYATGEIEDCIALLDRQLKLASKVSKGSRLSVLAIRSVRLACVGDLRLSRASLNEAEKLAEGLGSTVFRSTIDVARVVTKFLSGDWDDALECGHWFGFEAHRRPEALGLVIVQAFLAAIHLERGELLAARRLCEPSSNTRVGQGYAAWASSGLALARGQVKRAREIACGAWEVDRRSGRLCRAHLLLSRLVEIELLDGDRRAARRRSDELSSVAESLGSGWARLLALRARYLLDESVNACLEALEIARHYEMPFETATTAYHLGSMGHSPEQSLAEALEIFSKLRAEHWRRRALTAMRKRHIKVPRHRRREDGVLTAAEASLAELIRNGLTNREIAQSLNLSPKTVEVYLTRLYAKTGCSSRVALAVALSSNQVQVIAEGAGEGRNQKSTGPRAGLAQ